jgi:hypothetical protein
MTVSYIGSILAVLVSVAALITFAISRYKAAIEEGKHLETVEQLRRDLSAAYDKIHQLESITHNRDMIVGEIKADLKHVRDGLKRIEHKLDQHLAKDSE